MAFSHASQGDAGRPWGLPSEECLIVSVRRGRKLHMAHGYTTLERGDQGTVFGGCDCGSEVQQLLTGGVDTTGR